MTKIRITLLIIIVAIISLSFGFSAQTASESLTISDQVLIVLRIVTEEEALSHAPAYNQYSEVFREVAHAVLYSLITLPIFLFLYTWIKKLRVVIPLTFLLVMGYAILDEVHQLSVLGRDFEYFDLVMDAIGSLIVIGTASVVILMTNLMDSAKTRSQD
jgi:VanZ family protein